MSLLRGRIRPSTLHSDRAVERYLAAVRAQTDLDPLFRRRLRGEVMNRFVAAREGIAAVRQQRAMGALGRAVLYASFTLAATAGSVLAASQDALPGELLYPLKRQVEELRIQVLPAHLHDDLAAYALAERIEELGRLADRGSWDLVVTQAVTVEREYRAFLNGPLRRDASNGRYAVVLTELLEHLPATARTAVEDVLDGMPGIGHGNTNGSGSSGQQGQSGGLGGTGGSTGGRSQGSDGQSGPGTRPTPEPKPTKSPKPEPTPSAEMDVSGDE